MSTSPISSGDLVHSDDNLYQIVMPQFEYSKITNQQYKIAHRVAHFQKKFTSVFVVQYKHIFYFTNQSKLNYCFVCDGIAGEMHMSVTDSVFFCTVDLHEEWRKHNTNNHCTPFAVILQFTGRTIWLTKSGTCRVDMTLSGTLKSMVFQPTEKPHGVLLRFDRSTNLKRIATAHTPANGQMWTLALAPERLMLVPFCPLRGWVCTTCTKAYDTPLELIQHCLNNSALHAKKVVLNPVDHNGIVRMSSASMARYPVRQQARMHKYSYIGFRYQTLVQKLLALRLATQYTFGQ
mgnify:CR=1 FL=1